METPADPVICVGDSYLGLFDWRISDQFVLVESRRGAGKTRAILTLFMCRALAHPGSAWLVVRSTRVRLSDSAIKTFVEQVLPLFGLPIPTCQRSQIHNYRLPNGSEFIFQGLDDPGRQQSVECAGVYVVEGVEIEEIETITALAGAMRQVCTPPIPVHQCIVDCNPGHPSHPLNTISEHVDDSLRLVETKEQYLALVEHNQKPCTEPRRWKRIIAQHYDNPGYFDAERWEWLAAGLSYLKTLSWLTGYLVKQWLHGLWVAKEGSVFAGYFTRTRNVCPRFPIPKSWPIYFFLDPGRDHPCGASWVAVSPTRKRFIIAEIHESGLDYDSTAEKIKNIERGMGMTVTKRFLDPNAGFHHTYFAKHGASIAEEFVKLGLVFEAWARLAGPSKEAAVNVLCRSFKAGEVVVFEDCPGAIGEAETWAFKRTRGGERLTGDDQYEDKNNDILDGLIAEEVMDLPYQQGYVSTEQERDRQVMETALSINQAGPGRE